MNLRDLILHNFWLKLASLLLAAMMWYVIAATQTDLRLSQTGIQKNTEFTLENVPITVMKSATDLLPCKVIPTTVNITVSGSPKRLQTLGLHELEVFVNLKDVRQAENLIKQVLVFAPPGVKVVAVKPSEVLIQRSKP